MPDRKVLGQTRRSNIRRYLKMTKWSLGLALLVLEIIKHLMDVSQ